MDKVNLTTTVFYFYSQAEDRSKIKLVLLDLASICDVVLSNTNTPVTEEIIEWTDSLDFYNDFKPKIEYY